MARTGWNSILRQVHRLGPSERGNAADAGLLQRFSVNRDEAAFAVLIARHGPMVWALCRRLLHNVSDAEDAFQAAFLVLVRKAGSIRQPELLGAWLHGVAYRIALKLRTTVAVRSAKERPAIDPRAPESISDVERNELGQLLDREVSQLPERYRVPFVLCQLQGLTHEQAASRLRCPKGTVLSRLSRARAHLRQRLTRQGFGLSTAAVAALFAEPAGAGYVPLALRSATAKLALAFAGGGAAGLPSATAVALTEGMVTSMHVAKVKLAAAILLVLGLVGASGGLLGRRGEPLAQATNSPSKANLQDSPRPMPPVEKAAASEYPVPRPSKRKDVEIRETLARLTKYDGLEDPKETLADALDQLAAKYQLQFEINERAFKCERPPGILQMEIIGSNPIPPVTAPLATILRHILARLPEDKPAVYLIRNGCVEITTESAARRELNIPGDGPFPPLVFEHFEATPLIEALNAVADHADLNVLVQPTAAERISRLKINAPLHNVPAETAVRVLAQMGGLDLVRLGNVYYVLPKDESAKLEAK